MANQTHLEILKKGTEAWNKWREANSDFKPDLSGADLRGSNFPKADLHGADLSGADLSEVDLSEVDLSEANLRKADLSKADLFGSDLSKADLSTEATKLSEADLSKANLSEAYLFRADLSGVDLSGADLHGAGLNKAILNKAKLGDADLSDANLHKAKLREANLSGAKLRNTDLSGADLTEADLSGADLHRADIRGAVLNKADIRKTNIGFNEEHLNQLEVGVDHWNQYRKEEPHINPVLRGADLSKKDLRKANLSGADLSGADLRGADLRGADLSDADLSRANLYQAELKGANLGRAKLIRADLSEAFLRDAYLSKAILQRAKLSKARLPDAILREADLRGAKLSGADLNGNHFRGAKLNWAILREAKLRETDLRDADLSGANLRGADLSDACLSSAKLIKADLSGAKLRGADLSDAHLSAANLRDADLSEADLRVAEISGANLSGAILRDADLHYEWIRNLTAEEKEAYVKIRNLTARRIAIAGSKLVMPPFGERKLTLKEFQSFREKIEEWKLSSLISIEVEGFGDEKDKSKGIIQGTGIFLGLLLISLILFAPGFFVSTLRNNLWFWLGVGASILILAITLVGIDELRKHPESDGWKSEPAAKSLIGRLWYRGRQFLRFIRLAITRLFNVFSESFRLILNHSFSLILILAIGIGLPALIIYFFGGGKELLAPGQPLSLAHFGRGLQLIFIVIASLLPALLYFLFDRQQLGTLRENFYREVIQLMLKVVTLEDAKSIYGGRVAEVYGPEDTPGEKKHFLHGTRLPIFVATLVITLGWMITLMPVGPVPSIDKVTELYTLLIPGQAAVNYGFLGAYFFALNMVIRRYTRADLKPKAYSHITVRFLVVLILVWVLSVVPGIGDAAQGATSGPVLLVLAFFVGIVPETGLTVIREFLQKSIGKAFTSLEEKLPLTNLDGITLYERARLMEEGIENVENLVYGDLIDLMLQTRIPLTRLIDWVDQGILHLHLIEIQNDKKTRGSSQDTTQSPLATLRKYGIRNASDLVEVYKRAEERDRQKSKQLNHKETRQTEPPQAAEQLLGILNNSLGSSEGVQPLQVIYDALQNDEWLTNILNWRERSRLPGEHLYELEDIYIPFKELKEKLEISGVSKGSDPDI